MYNAAGQLVLAYTVHRAWVSRYQALPDLDADADAVAIAQIRLENEGWERRDISGEPAEPDYPAADPSDQQPPIPNVASDTLWYIQGACQPLTHEGPR